MGIYIRGMEMPTEDEEIFIRIDSSGTVMTEYALPISGTKAIPVPPHGRLGDLDALRELAYQRQKEMGIACCVDALDIALAPTVIEAEQKGE